jgi:hypothetical protein
MITDWAHRPGAFAGFLRAQVVIMLAGPRGVQTVWTTKSSTTRSRKASTDASR